MGVARNTPSRVFNHILEAKGRVILPLFCGNFKYICGP